MNMMGRTYEEGYAAGIQKAMNLVVLKMRAAHDALNKVRDIDELKNVRKEINKWDRLYAELNNELGNVIAPDEIEDEDKAPQDTPKVQVRIGNGGKVKGIEKVEEGKATT